jgi:ankyrin repeat protein
MVRTLVTSGAKVDAAAADGTTPLIAAVRSGPVPTVQFLAPESSIDARDQAGQSAAMIAVQMGQAEKLILLLNEGAAVESATADGTTLLGLAATGGGGEGVTKVLLEAGAKVDAADAKGVTPLMKAAARDDVKQVFLLLDAGASASARDAAGKSVLDYARTQSGVKKVESIQVLVSAGAT